MGKLRDRMEEDLKLGGYSPATQRVYLLYAREFARYHMRSPADMGEEEIRAYLMHHQAHQQYVSFFWQRTDPDFSVSVGFVSSCPITEPNLL